MTEKNLSQTVDFSGEIKKQEKYTELKVMDFNTQNALMEMNRNHNKMINNMFYVCSNFCFKKFSGANLTSIEKTCAENCQKKFYSAYNIGSRLMDRLMKESDKIDIFSDKNEVDIVKDSRK
jgi:hypothetical protein